MKKKDMKDIPTLEEGIESLKSEDSSEEEPKEQNQEESKLQIVTSEQLIQFKLDNLSSQVQELIAQINALVEVLKRKK